MTGRPPAGSRVVHVDGAAGVVRGYFTPEYTPRQYRRSHCRVAFDDGVTRWTPWLNLAYETTQTQTKGQNP